MPVGIADERVTRLHGKSDNWMHVARGGGAVQSLRKVLA